MRSSLLCLGLSLAALTGCSSVESMPTTVRERFSAPTYHTRVVNADQRTAYEAAKRALKKIEFRFVRGGAAQGKLNGLSRIVGANDMMGSRQLEIDVKLSPVDAGTEVAVLLSEMTEDQFTQSAGMGNSKPLRESALYDAYFRFVEEALAAPAE